MEIPMDREIIELPASTIWFDNDGILCSVSKKMPAQTVEDARRSLEQYKNLTGGKKFCMLIDITNSSPASKEIREFAAEQLPRLVTAIAMVSGSPLGRMMATLFFALKPPPYPAKLFGNETEAKAWLKQYL